MVGVAVKVVAAPAQTFVEGTLIETDASTFAFTVKVVVEAEVCVEDDTQPPALLVIVA